MELDHIFICTKNGAPEAQELINFGLVEGSSNTHPGQGTSNRRFYFNNAYIELLWMHDKKEGNSPITSQTKLYERCCMRTDSISPFGIGFRSDRADEKGASFNYWCYMPEYFPSHIEIQVGSNTPLSEPMWFYINVKPTNKKPKRKKMIEPRNHSVPLHTLTHATIYINNNELSDVAKIVNEIDNVKLVTARESLLVLEFNDGESKLQKDFRPQLPLIIMW